MDGPDSEWRILAMNYLCRDCDAKFSEMEQTKSQYDDGCCPYCGGNDIVDIEDCQMAEEK